MSTIVAYLKAVIACAISIVPKLHMLIREADFVFAQGAGDFQGSNVRMSENLHVSNSALPVEYNSYVPP